LAAVVNKQLLPGAMFLTHGKIKFLLPFAKQFTELAVMCLAT